jgi:hypothetical protein
MQDWLKKYLLSTAVRYAPPDMPAEPDDERIPEPSLDDDEIVTDPVGETEGDENDEGDDDDDEGDDTDDEGGEPEPAARQSRGDRTVGTLRKLARERAEENAKLTRELAEMRGRIDQISRQPAAPIETAAQRAERMALMSPEDRAMEMVNESLRRHEHQQAQLTNTLLDQSDRSAFEARAAATPLLRKLAPEVERVRQTIMQRDGNQISRMDVATYLIGQKVLQQGGQGKQAAQGRRRQQQARPASGRGDVASPRRERRAGGDPVAQFEDKFGDTPI